ncbi:DNA primase regulatory subunit PriL [Natranaeroarchaeum sulfidigenes]|uniref:DNA primase regulatory subunit PriL n=1 Tax=Natranaeroarchaeum sulfidigenes TaxID=2784880 RepID=UPI001EE554DB|nr:DNA primase regulatory subunit PriL [Natranaeroarchaeum sulfidigenes]
MKRLYARYPFLDDARKAVEAAEVDLVELVNRDGAAAVDRAVERVDAALREGTIGQPHRRTRVELLSYPIARVLVSLVDEHVLIRKYAHAEAAAARERFEADLSSDTQLKSTSDERLTVDHLLAEFDLTGDVRPAPEGYRIAVGSYLRLSADLDGEEWRLVNRALSNGSVPVEEAELHDLLQQAIRDRITEGLPLSVPDPIAAGLDDAVDSLDESLADRQLSTDFDAVRPDLFPPCVKALLDRVEAGDELNHTGRFTLTAFLTSVGMSPGEVAELSAGDEFNDETIQYQAAHLGENGTGEYPPPSCATMDTFGLCVDKDELCSEIDHPLTYYDERLDASAE